MKIQFSDNIKQTCPNLAVAILECEVINSVSDSALWEEIEQKCEQIIIAYAIETINKRPVIAATRQAYKLLGKDPNRYRPSAEALCRRIARGLPLYKVNTLVDLINLVSIQSGYSIGGFDADKIEGNITLGVGTADDEFEAIGRGLLNVEGLPLYRDAKGGIGTPTSDNERTKLSVTTTRLLMIVNGYSGEEGLREAVVYAKQLLEKYSSLENSRVRYLKASE